jgi:hypothetical protein
MNEKLGKSIGTERLRELWMQNTAYMLEFPFGLKKM